MPENIPTVDSDPVESCEHDWEFIGTSTMLDPDNGEKRTVNNYTCSKCHTSKSEWA